jgi:hypothetical protein
MASGVARITDLGSERDARRPSRVAPGTPVFDCDGARLGSVAETFGRIFHLAGPEHDCWLAYDAVAEVLADERIVLRISRASIERHRVHLDTAS